MEVIGVSRGSNGSREPREESARPKRKPVRPEDVRVVRAHRDGKGIEGMALGAKASAALRKQRRSKA